MQSFTAPPLPLMLCDMLPGFSFVVLANAATALAVA
jgi:hypothetical protein